jgi:hypothetical protein
MHTVDEGIRPSTSIEALAKLKPILTNGVLTAAAASQICDGAAAMLVCNERGLQRLGLRPRARVVALGLAALDPVVMLEGPIPATQQALAKAQLQIEDVDLVEVNEAFSSIPLAWAKAMTGGDLTKLNVNGGAIARGHPLGATGAMLMSNLVGELERRGGRYGLLTMCESGGTANATIVERVGHSGLVNTILASSRLAPGPVSGGPAEPILEFARPSPQKGHAFMTMGRALTAIAAWKGQAPALTSAGPGTVAKQKFHRARSEEQRNGQGLHLLQCSQERPCHNCIAHWTRVRGGMLCLLETWRDPEQCQLLADIPGAR